MSKRLCISLLHAPRRTHQSIPQCALQTRHHNLPSDRHNVQHSRRQPFSSSQQHAARGKVSPGRQASLKAPPQGSIALLRQKQLAEMQRDGSYLEVIGLQQTFVPPTSAPLLPSPFTHFRDRIKLERARFWQHMKTYLYTPFMSRIWFKVPDERHKTAAIASEIYEKMYTALAAGNLHTLEGQVSSGMLSNLRNRIGQRTADESLEWTLHKHLSPPRVISYFPFIHKAGRKGASSENFKPILLGKGKNSTTDGPTGMLQAVIRLRTRQSLLRLAKRRHRDPHTGRVALRDTVVDAEGNEVEKEFVEKYRLRQAKDLTEYVVLQKFIKLGKEGEWHIQGMVEEMGLQKLEDQAKATEKLMMMQQKHMNQGTAPKAA